MSIDRRRMSGGYFPLRDVMNQLFENSMVTPSMFSAQGGFPPVDIYATDDDIVIEMAAPGLDPNNVNISVTGNAVTVSGEVKREQRNQRGQSYVEEIWEGRFERAFTLPMPVDSGKADASFENGILRLRLPKAEAHRPRKIEVRRSQPTISGEATTSSNGGTQKENVPVQSS